MSSEVEKLRTTMKRMYDEGMSNIHIAWGPEVNTMTPEERAKAINDVLEASGEPIDSIDRNTPQVLYNAPFKD